MPVFKKKFCFLSPVTLNFTGSEALVLKEKWSHQVIQQWFDSTGSGNSHLAILAPYATETTGKVGEYVSGWSEGSRWPGGNWVAVTGERRRCMEPKGVL